MCSFGHVEEDANSDSSDVNLGTNA